MSGGFEIPKNAARFNAGELLAADFLTVTHDPSLSPMGSYTIEAWVATTDNDSERNVIVSKPAGGASTFALEITDGMARISTNIGAFAFAVQDTAIISDGDYHHLAGVFDSALGTLTLYVDGI